MIISKKKLSRRAVLQGMGATIALPLLDSMVPAFTVLAQTAAKPTRRLGVVYVPNGIMMENWTPQVVGRAFEFTPILKPLEPFRDRLVIISGLDNDRIHAGDHTGASTKFLTAVPCKPGVGQVEAGTSMDQIAAQRLAGDTPLSSLELALDSPENLGSCSVNGFSCVYTNTIAWRNPTTPLPMEYNPRTVFERLFGDNESTDPRVRQDRARKDRSILDSVTEKVADLQRGLGPADRAKLGQYLEAVRDVERRIQRVEAASEQEVPAADRPVGVPSSFEEHARLMFDLLHLAYQTDVTRVFTFMLGREFSGRAYPEIGVPDAHHPTSHHQNDPDKLAKLVKVNTYHMTQFAYFLEKLRSTPDGDGSLLDHVLLIYGAGMSDGNRHLHKNLPLLLLGGAAGQLKGGRHVRSPQTPLANLHVTLLDKLGIEIERVGDSTGELALDMVSDV